MNPRHGILESVQEWTLGKPEYPSQFEQVVINLAINAGDAMQTGRKHTIEAGKESIDWIRNREHLPPVSIDGQFPSFPAIFLFSFVDENADGFRCDIEILADRFGDILDKPSLLFDCSSLIRLDNDQWHDCVPPVGFRLQ